MGTLKELRAEKKLTQKQAAEYVGVSLRSYKSYETDSLKADTIKYHYIVDKLSELTVIDETHGVLSIAEIRQACTAVLQGYDVRYCYLFGSYAKGTAGPTSDIDLLISSNVSGLCFYGMVEELRTALHKKVDVLDIQQLKNNFELTQEILQDGVRIYG